MKYDKEFKLQVLQLSDEIGVKAAANRFPLAGAALHSDRGSQHTEG